MVGRELVTACLYQLITKTLKATLTCCHCVYDVAAWQFPGHVINYAELEAVCLKECVASSLVDSMSSDFIVKENTAEFAAVNASPPADIGYASVPCCSIMVQ